MKGTRHYNTVLRDSTGLKKASDRGMGSHCGAGCVVCMWASCRTDMHVGRCSFRASIYYEKETKGYTLYHETRDKDQLFLWNSLTLSREAG